MCPIKKIVFMQNHDFLMKGISCQCEYNVQIWFRVGWIMKVYIYINCKLINIVIYIIQNRFLFYFISDNTSDSLNFLLVRLVFYCLSIILIFLNMFGGGAKKKIPLAPPLTKCLIERLRRVYYNSKHQSDKNEISV